MPGPALGPMMSDAVFNEILENLGAALRRTPPRPHVRPDRGFPCPPFLKVLGAMLRSPAMVQTEFSGCAGMFGIYYVALQQAHDCLRGAIPGYAALHRDVAGLGREKAAAAGLLNLARTCGVIAVRLGMPIGVFVQSVRDQARAGGPLCEGRIYAADAIGVIWACADDTLAALKTQESDPADVLDHLIIDATIIARLGANLGYWEIGS